MPKKRAYSTYTSSNPASSLATANGFDAPPPQAQHQSTYFSPRIHIPGAWPSEYDATATQEVAPAHSSFFTTVHRWTATMSIRNLLNLPQHLARRFFRRQTIQAVPIIGSDGSNKRRFIATGVADEVATSSPSVRARANQTRRQNFTRNTHTLQRDIWSPSPLQTHQSTTNFFTPSSVTYHTPPANTPTSLYAPDDVYEEDISMEFEFDNMLFSTPPRNPQTGSPMYIQFDSPHDQSPSGQTQSTHTQADSPGATQHVNRPAYLPWKSRQFLSYVGQTSPAPASPRPKGFAGSTSTLDRPSYNTPQYLSVTPMRRQLVKLQFGAEVRRLQTPQEAEGQADAPEEGFAETGAATEDSDMSYPPDASSSPFQSNVDSLHRTPEAESFYEEIELAEPFEYENDLSFLLDAPTPPRPRGVRWNKHSDVKHFFYDARVADMLDETLESITSDHDTSISFWEGRGRRNREEVYSDDEASSPSRSSAGSPTDGDDDNVDDSLEESMISDELAENLHDAFMNKMALEALSAPPPPPPPAPKFLVTPLSPEEREKLESAAAETANGRLPDKWVIEEKLYARDFATLLPRMFNGDLKAWLNDNIVNEYLSMLIAAKKEEAGFKHQRGGPAPPVHAFSSFWYQTENTSRWPARFQLQGKQYLDAQLILYPICDRGHWRLLAVYPDKRHIEYLDSLGLDGGKYIAKLKTCLKAQLGADFNVKEWTIETDQRSTQQMNGSDCGVFTLLNALTLLRGDESERVIADNGMNEARQRIAVTLLAGGPTTEFD